MPEQNIPVMSDKMVSVMTDEAADKLTLVIEDKHGYRDYVDMDSRQAARVADLLAPQGRAYECLDALCFAVEQQQVFGDDAGVEVSLKAARELLRLHNEGDAAHSIAKKLAAALELAAEHWSPVLSDEITDQVEEARELAQKAGYLG